MLLSDYLSSKLVDTRLLVTDWPALPHEFTKLKPV